MKLPAPAAIFVLISGLVALLATAASPAAAQEVLYYQPPLPFGGSSSNGLTITVADDFRLAAGADLEQVVWWGGYGSAQLPRPTGDAFTLRIFGDDGGQPGQVLATYTFGAEVRRSQTSPTDFDYAFTLPAPLALEGHRTYWLSITDVPTSLDWMWTGSTFEQETCTPSAPCCLRSFGSPITGPWEGSSPNLAFQLLGTPAACPEVTIELQVEPDVINPHVRGGWVTGYLEPPALYTASQIDETTVRLSTGLGNIAADPATTGELGDHDRDGVSDLALKFKRSDVIGILDGNPTTLVATGEFLGLGVCFRGSDQMRVVPTSASPIALDPGDRASFALHGTQPHPARAGTGLSISFTLPDAGPARLELFDIAGRFIAAQEVGSLGPGRHTTALATGRLGAGVYRVRLMRGGESRELHVVLVP